MTASGKGACGSGKGPGKTATIAKGKAWVNKGGGKGEVVILEP